MKNVSGKIEIQADQHVVEYDLDAEYGRGLLHLRLDGGQAYVPIYHDHIDSVIAALQKGKRAIEALEMPQSE